MNILSILCLSELNLIQQIGKMWLLTITIVDVVVSIAQLTLSECERNQNQTASKIDIVTNCIANKSDNSDPDKLICFTIHRYCVRKCVNSEKCSVIYVVATKRGMNQTTLIPGRIHCFCGYNQFKRGCAITYESDWEEVVREFHSECLPKEEVTSSTIEAKTDCLTSDLIAPDNGKYLFIGTNGSTIRNGTIAKLVCLDGYKLVQPATDGRLCFKVNGTNITCEEGADCDKRYVPVNDDGDKETHICQQVAWEGKSHLQLGYKCINKTDDFNTSCSSLNSLHYYADNRCFVREGLRDISKERECNELPNGHLLTQKTQRELNIIVDRLKHAGYIKHEGYEIYVRLSEHLKPRQTLRFRGHMTKVKKADRFISSTLIQLHGTKDIDLDGFLYQHIPLQIIIDLLKNEMDFLSYAQGIDGEINTNRRNNITRDLPKTLRNTRTFDILITYKYNDQFELKIGNFNYSFPYGNSSLHYINDVVFWNRGNLHSVTLDGKELLLADDDRFYTDCMAVGLTDGMHERNKNTKAGWTWQNGNGYSWPADPETTLWDIDAHEPDNKGGQEYYGCVNIHTNKLRDTPGYLKRYVICEYEKEVTYKCYHLKGNNTQGPKSALIKRETGITTIEMCANLCNLINSCHSFNIKRTVGYCDLYLMKSEDMETFPDDTADGYQFYDRI